jgi:ABC-type nitrate/sulfonate/bicarbonate transport system ATPase subunit
MITVTNLSYAFPAQNRGLSDISFSVHENEILVLLGPSGCGKSTLLHLLSGHLIPNTGDILIDGFPPKIKRSLLGILYQDPRLIPWLNIRENICLPNKIQLLNDNSVINFDNLIDVLRLKNHLTAYPIQLSGGEQERAAIARSLINAPNVLMLDEPLDSTDYMHRLEVEDYIFNYVRNYKACCIIVTHDLEMALSLGDEILLMPVIENHIKAEKFSISPVLKALLPSQARVSQEMTKSLFMLLKKYRELYQ